MTTDITCKHGMQQTTNRIFMVRPAHFGFNEETAASNVFQNRPEKGVVIQQILFEFDNAVQSLRTAGVNVDVIEDIPDIVRPDAIFPNNWISTHEDGTIVLYPMYTPNRRTERRADIVSALKERYQVSRTIDLSAYEQEGLFLEGTGSIVFDHTARVAYACLSPRTHPQLLQRLCAELGYETFTFIATDPYDQEVYHTNVIMGIAAGYAIVCLESIRDKQVAEELTRQLELSGKQVIAISWQQTLNFAGNVLELLSDEGISTLAISTQAFRMLTPEQTTKIREFSNIVPIDIHHIETIGGGSIRCMIAQNFLMPRSEN